MLTTSNGLAAEALTVRVEGLAQPSGHVMIALYDRADAYEIGDEQALRRERLPVDDRLEVVWAVDGLASGDYGVALFHDVDDDEVLDTNFVGLPKEPYGFSNNARGRFGPPDYDAITFAFDGAPLTITIQAK
jgi:uncharacterized protein (DUF2141 family)